MLTERLKSPFVLTALAAGIFLSGIPVLRAADVEQEKPPVVESSDVQPAAPVESAKKPEVEEALKEIKEGIKALQRSQADAGADMTAVGDQIRQLRGEIEEIARSLEGLRNDRKELEAKMRSLSSSIKVMEMLLGVRDGKREEQKRWEEKPAPLPEGAGDVKSAESEMFAGAFENMREGRYAEARDKFGKYLAQNPEAELAGEAQFWIGECYYLEKEYEQAILEFEKVIKDYPQSDKVRQALLGQGFSFYRLGDLASAKLFFKKIVDDFPETLEARIAKQRLDRPQEKP